MHLRGAGAVRPQFLCAVLAALAAGAYPLLTGPVERVPVAVAPLANQTGYAELDPYRLALTQVLVSELAESPNVRVLPYPRLLQSIRRFLTGATDMSSREAIRALAADSGTAMVVVPTLLYENGAWRGRAELQDAATGINAAVYDTEPAASSLPKDAAYALTASLAQQVERHFVEHGPGASYTPRPTSARLRTLDAARAFEEGVNAYEELDTPAHVRPLRALPSRTPGMRCRWHGSAVCRSSCETQTGRRTPQNVRRGW